jgi:transcriptional regulator with GAF, ATPase, and Fis domain
MAQAGTAPPPVPALPGEHDSPLRTVSKAKEDAETGAIVKALETTHWNRKHAAELLNIEYRALLYKMKKLSIDCGDRFEGRAGRSGTGTA